MTRYTELENIAINVVLDTSLEILTMMLPSSNDDDERLSLLSEYFTAAYEQRADVHPVPENCKDLLHRYVESMKSTSVVYRQTVEEMTFVELDDSTEEKNCTCEKCSSTVPSSEHLFLIMEDDTSELFVCINCVQNRRAELQNRTCQVCETTDQDLKLCVSANESTGEQEYQRACSSCIEMFNLEVVDD